MLGFGCDDYVTDDETVINLILNGSFEDDFNGFTSSGDATITISTEQSLFGDKSVRFEETTDSGNAHDYVYFNYNSEEETIGKTYTLSTYFYLENLTYESTSVGLYLIVYYTDSSNDTFYSKVRQSGIEECNGDSCNHINVSLYNEWQRQSITFTTDSTRTVNYIRIYAPHTNHMRSGDVFYTDGIQLEEGEILHDYVDFNNPQIIGDCEISEAGTPDNPRYWKNIIPEDYTLQYHRKGIGALPPLPDDSLVDFFEIVFGWGMMNKNKIQLENESYKTVQILFSKSSGDDITKIEMEFEGITLPNISNPTVGTFGGITEVDNMDNNFSMVIDDNKLILDFIEEFNSFSTIFNIDNFSIVGNFDIAVSGLNNVAIYNENINS